MTTTTMKPRPPSARSVEYLTDLVRDRDVNPGRTAIECLAELTKWLARKPRTQKDVSDMIDRSKAAPRRSVFTPTPVPGSAATVYVPYPSVPDSVPNAKFAVLSELLTQIPPGWRTQELVFFEVKELRKRRVIRRLTGAPGKFNRTALPAAAASELLGMLESQEFAYQASLAFGEFYRVCSRCAAELTDDLSRERKMGPVCWDLMEPWRAKALAAAAAL